MLEIAGKIGVILFHVASSLVLVVLGHSLIVDFVKMNMCATCPKNKEKA